MAIYRVHLLGDRHPIDVELFYDRLDDVASDAATCRFLTGHLASPDENGCFKGIIIATNRIQCICETE